jgi:hypothetical protein
VEASLLAGRRSYEIDHPAREVDGVVAKTLVETRPLDCVSLVSRNRHVTANRHALRVAGESGAFVEPS